MKKLIIGFILGAVTFSLAPAFAASLEQYILNKTDYKVYINAEEYTDKDKPVLNYKGIYYIPVSEFSEKMGINSEINIKGKRIDFKNASAIEIPINELTGMPVGALSINRSDNNISYRTIWFENEHYISLEDLSRVFRIYLTTYDSKNDTVTFIKDTKQIVVDISSKLNRFTINNVTYYKMTLFKDLMQ